MAKTTVEYRGEILEIPPFDRRTLAECELHYLSTRPSVLSETLKACLTALSITDDKVAAIFAEAKAQAATLPEVEAKAVESKAAERAGRLLAFTNRLCETTRSEALQHDCQHHCEPQELHAWLGTINGEFVGFTKLLERAYPGRFNDDQAWELLAIWREVPDANEADESADA